MLATGLGGFAFTRPILDPLLDLVPTWLLRLAEACSLLGESVPRARYHLAWGWLSAAARLAYPAWYLPCRMRSLTASPQASVCYRNLVKVSSRRRWPAPRPPRLQQQCRPQQQRRQQQQQQQELPQVTPRRGTRPARSSPWLRQPHRP